MRGKRAVVMGGGIAGYCCAAVLAKHFAEVLVLERDPRTPDGVHRRGAPQSRHPHAIMDGARQALEEIFPGFERRFIESGGLMLNPGLEMAHCEPRGWAPRQRTRINMIYSSRLLLEANIRRNVEQVSNVELRFESRVKNLRWATSEAPRVTGVVVEQGRELVELEADLIVDATGKGTRVPKWLEQRALGKLETLSVDAKVTYSTRWLKAPSPEQIPAHMWWRQIVIYPLDLSDPEDPRGFLANLSPLEDGGWIALIGSWGGVPMPKDAATWMELAQRLRAPTFARTVALATPASDVFITKSTANRWYRYDRAATLPHGFIAIGDAVACFNPLYGQGMSAGSLAAVLLDRVCREHASPDAAFARSWFGQQARYLHGPWQVALARDRLHPRARGTEVIRNQMLAAGFRKAVAPGFQMLMDASRIDSAVDEGLGEVFGVRESLSSYLRRPRVLFGLGRAAAKRALRLHPLPPNHTERDDPPATIHAANHPHFARA